MRAMSAPQPYPGWAPMWDRPNSDRFVVGFDFSRTRAEAWDSILPTWFNKVEVGGKTLYVPYQKSRRTGDLLTRDAAIHRMRRRGLRVVRARVVQA